MTFAEHILKPENDLKQFCGLRMVVSAEQLMAACATLLPWHHILKHIKFLNMADSALLGLPTELSSHIAPVLPDWLASGHHGLFIFHISSYVKWLKIF